MGFLIILLVSVPICGSALDLRVMISAFQQNDQRWEKTKHRTIRLLQHSEARAKNFQNMRARRKSIFSLDGVFEYRAQDIDSGARCCCTYRKSSDDGVRQA